MIPDSGVKYAERIPGDGMYVVGVDVAPGRYVCGAPGDGYWVRYPDNGVGPVTGRRHGTGAAEVVIEPGDTAFDSHMPGEWTRAGVRRPPIPQASPGHTAPVKKKPTVKPVLDPDLPPELVQMLAADPTLLRHVRGGDRWNPDNGRRDPSWISAIMVLIGVFLLFGLVRWAGPFGLIGGLFLIGSGPRVTRRLRTRPARRRRRIAIRHKDRFRVDRDFDPAARALLLRTQRAIRRISESSVSAAGLLDIAENAVVLPQQEWEVAKALSRVSQLRAEQAAMAAQGMTPQVEEALAPMRSTLDTVVASVTSRIEALERYAEKVREADRAYRAHEQMRLLIERAGAYQELLVETVRDDLAVSEIERLTRNTEALEQALSASLEAARRAGTALIA